ncbi:MAG: histidine kinase dimerization/phospho-acceptor domain-containing protein, partial [Pseudomonadota bacterium]
MDPDIVPVALMELDHRRRIVSANTGAETLLGFSRHVLDGRSLTDLLYHDCALFDLLDRADETVGSVSAGALKLSGPNLHTGNHHVSVNRVPGGGFALAFAKSAQQDPAASAAPGLAAFGKILGHEVKNPLAGISGAAQLLKRSATEDQGELLDLVLAESRRIERLVDELSAFELFSRPERAPCNIHEVLDLVIRAEQLAV